MCDTFFSLLFFFVFFPAFEAEQASPPLQPQNHRFVVIVSPILSLFKHTRARFERKVRNSLPFPHLSLFYIVARGRENTFSALLNRENFFFFSTLKRGERELRRFDYTAGVCLLFHFLGSIFSLSLSLSLLNEESGNRPIANEALTRRIYLVSLAFFHRRVSRRSE